MAERRRWWRTAQALLALLVIGLAVRRLAGSWDALRAQPVAWEVRPAWLVASVAIVWTAYALLVEAWRRVVVSMHQRLGYRDAARICMVSNLGKYLPGKVWAIAGNALLAQQAGVDAPAAVAAALVNQALALGSGLALVGALSPAALRAAPAWMVVVTLTLGIGALLGVVALSSPRALGTLRRVLPASWPALAPIPAGVMLAAFLVNVVAWAAYGLAFQCLARGLTADVTLGWGLAATVFTISYLVGLVAVFAPAGLGPRESLFYLLLAGAVGPKLAVALALATRVLLTITELGAAAPFLVVRKGALR